MNLDPLNCQYLPTIAKTQLWLADPAPIQLSYPLFFPPPAPSHSGKGTVYTSEHPKLAGVHISTLHTRTEMEPGSGGARL